jgi:hypothetical protein
MMNGLEARNPHVERIMNNDKKIRKSESLTRLQEFSSSTLDAQTIDLVKCVNKLIDTCKDPQQQSHFKLEMEGFKKLFVQYKQSRGKVIEWDKVCRLYLK